MQAGESSPGPALPRTLPSSIPNYQGNRHCLLSAVTSLCRAERSEGIREKERGGDGRRQRGVALDGGSDLWKIKCDAFANVATLCLLRASSNSHSSLIISSPHPPLLTCLHEEEGQEVEENFARSLDDFSILYYSLPQRCCRPSNGLFLPRDSVYRC